MSSTPQGGAVLKKTDERSRGRRKRKTLHQAGCPESSTSCECSQLHRLAYFMRTGPTPRNARRLFYSIVKTLKKVNTDTPQQSSTMYRRVKVGGRVTCIPFVKAKLPPYKPAPVDLRQIGVRKCIPALTRAYATPWIAFDCRIRDTFIEDNDFRFFRERIEHCASRWTRSTALVFNSDEMERLNKNTKLQEFLALHDVRGQYGAPIHFWVESNQCTGSPLGRVCQTGVFAFQAKIGDYTLSRAVNHVNGEQLSVAAMVYEHLETLRDFLPDF